MSDGPTVSVILPTLNERAFIHDCLDTLVAQEYPDVVEILVVDGGSADGTRDIAGSFGEPVRVVDNPRTTAAAALNIGLAEAKGDLVVRVDAHTLYAPGYVRGCVDALQEAGVVNAGGPMRALGTTRFGQAVAAVTSSPLGVGPGRFHYSRQREDVDTVYLGSWWRSTLEELGGWDEENLQWGAEDHELNLRTTERGGRIVLDPSIESWYFVRETPRALWRQYFNYGIGKTSTLAKHRRLPTWRPLAPGAFVGASLLLLGFGRRRWLRAALPVGHAVACAVAARRFSRQPGVDPARAFVAVEICHWSYGLGFWSGIMRLATGRGYDSRPTGHR